MIVGVDQVLLDLVYEVDDDPGIFARYGIAAKTQSLAEAHHGPFLDDLLARAESGQQASACPVRKVPGGVVANSMRAVAYGLRQGESRFMPGALLRPQLKMCGMVGDDSAAELLRSELKQAGVDPHFTVKPSRELDSKTMSEKTGVCGCLISKKERTMLTALGAGQTMKLGGVDGRDEPGYPSWHTRIKELEATSGGEQAKLPVMVILSGFYIKEDIEGARAILRWCRDARTERRLRPLLAVTVGAEWCCGLPEVQEIARAADFLFSNEPEVKALADQLQRRGAIDKVTNCPVTDVARWKATGWVIATHGAKSVGVVRASSASIGLPPSWVPVQRVPTEEFVDDVGAGDSFLGGFCGCVWNSLAQHMASEEDSPWWLPCCGNRPSSKTWPEEGFAEDPAGALLGEDDVEAACRAGIMTASACCRNVGCQFPA